MLLYGLTGCSVLLVMALGLWLLLKPVAGQTKQARRDDAGDTVIPPVIPPSGVDAAWLGRVAGLPPEDQVGAVAAKLKELNPGFDGKVTHRAEGGAVTELQFLTDEVADIRPARALVGLKKFVCFGSHFGRGKLSDLSPLKGMGLTSLYMQNTRVSALSPVKGMPLTVLDCHQTPVSDLSPLEGMKLTELNVLGTRVVTLSPLKGMPLTRLSCLGTPVTDLAPLGGMKQLRELICESTRVSELSPLKGLRLTVLNVANTPVDDLSPVERMPLAYLNCTSTPVSTLAPLKGMKSLRDLYCAGTNVSDLSPLKGLTLQVLQCPFVLERDADLLRSVATLGHINGKPAKEVWADVDAQRVAFREWLATTAALPPQKQVGEVSDKLKGLNPGFNGTLTHRIAGGVVTALGFSADAVDDIRPLRALPGLLSLDCQGSASGKGRLSDLGPLKGMNLTDLRCGNSKVTDLSPLAGMPLENLWCDFVPRRDIALLRSLRTLTTINGKPAKEFLESASPKKP